MKSTIGSICFTVLVIGCATAQVDVAPGPAAASPVTDIRVKINTTKGPIEATLYATKTPMTVANFLNLSKHGFYDGIVFHRVIPDFMAQVGDPLSKDPSQRRRWGTGGPGYTFADETRSDLRHDRPGVFSMANSGRNTNGSQIFITHVPTPHLDGKHTVFGNVTKGQNVVDSVTVGDKIVSIEILDSTDALFQAEADNIAKWNQKLK